MKKISLMVLAIIITTNVINAQTNKGDWMVGGNVAINTTKDNSVFDFRPSAGYFFAKNFVAGAALTLEFEKFGDTKTSVIGVGPYARYYFDLKKPDFKPFINADFTLANSVIKTSTGIKTSNTITSFFIGAGGAFFINSNVALEAVAGYNRSKVETSPANAGFLFRIGFQVHLLGH